MLSKKISELEVSFKERGRSRFKERLFEDFRRLRLLYSDDFKGCYVNYCINGRLDVFVFGLSVLLSLDIVEFLDSIKIKGVVIE